MKYVSNTTKNPISYKDKVIPPGASVMLNNKGEIVDEVTDNTEEIEKLKGAVSKAVTLAQVDTRLEEVECRITNLVTSANSKKTFDLGSYGPVYDEKCLHKTDGKPVEFFYTCCCYPVNIEPGLYLGKLPNGGMKGAEFSVGDTWTWSGGSYKNEKGCILTRIEPHFSYKCIYNFESYCGAIYEIDEKAAKNSYVIVETSFDACRNCGWKSQINKPYSCVKNCFEAFEKNNSVCLSGNLIKLQ